VGRAVARELRRLWQFAWFSRGTFVPRSPSSATRNNRRCVDFRGYEFAAVGKRFVGEEHGAKEFKP